MRDREFSDIQIFQHSEKGIPLFMTGHKHCLQADYLLGPGPRLMKKEFTGPRSHKRWETLMSRKPFWALQAAGYNKLPYIPFDKTLQVIRFAP
jgi:hypothetical protein